MGLPLTLMYSNNLDARGFHGPYTTLPIETVQFQRACSVLRAKNAEEIKITSIVDTYDTEGIEKS